MERLILYELTPDDLKKIIQDAVDIALKNKSVEPELLDELITRKELKDLTGILSDVTVIRFERMGVFKPIRLGRKLFYRRSDVNKMLEKHKIRKV